MKRGSPVIALLLSLLFCGFSGAQETRNARETAGPDLVLPGMVFRIEGLPPEDLEPVFPGEEPPTLPFPAPDPSLAPEPPIPGSIVEGDGVRDGSATRRTTESSVFGRGTLGVGSMNGILGELSVAKTGGDLRFRAAFSHDGADGFGFRSPGTGYFRRDDGVDAAFDMDIAGGTLAAGASYRETEEGLQRLSPVYSAVTRLVAADTALSLRPAEKVSLRVTGTGAFAGKTLTSPEATPPGIERTGAEYSAAAGGAADYTAETHRLGLAVRYGLRSSPDRGDLSVRRFDAAASGALFLPEGWSLDARAGVFWSGRDPLLPFTVGVSGRGGDLVTFGVRGGLRVCEYDYRELWKDLGLLGLQAELKDGFAWFGEASVQGKTRDDRVRLSGRFEALRREGALRLRDFDPAAASFPFSSEDMVSWIIGAEASFRLFSGFSVYGAGKTVLGDRAFLEEAHRWEPGVRFLSPTGKAGASLSGVFDSGDGTATADLRFRGSLKPGEGLEFSLSAEDLLAALGKERRPRVPPFIGPGFRVMISTTVSF